MKQPELGKKLAEIRKGKGITQEELVDRCNVTVRTIQRIEAGDVVPRLVTMKLIAEALDCNLESFSNSEAEDKKVKPWINRATITDLDDPNNIALQLRIAWIAGIIYFLSGFPEAVLDYDFFKSGFLAVSNEAYILIKVIAMVSFIFFARGFIIMGYKYNNSLLTYGSYLFLAVLILNYSFDIFSIGLSHTKIEESMLGKAISFGIAGVIMGLGLRRMVSTFGMTATCAGSLEIIAGLMFLTVVLSPIGLLLLIPTEVIEVYLIFKYCQSLVAAQSDALK